MSVKKNAGKKPFSPEERPAPDSGKAAGKIAVTVSFSTSGNGDNLLESFTICGRTFLVREVKDGWFGADNTYVKLVASDGCLYILRHDLTTDEWEIVLMEAAQDERS